MMPWKYHVMGLHDKIKPNIVLKIMEKSKIEVSRKLVGTHRKNYCR